MSWVLNWLHLLYLLMLVEYPMVMLWVLKRLNNLWSTILLGHPLVMSWVLNWLDFLYVPLQLVKCWDLDCPYDLYLLIRMGHPLMISWVLNWLYILSSPSGVWQKNGEAVRFLSVSNKMRMVTMICQCFIKTMIFFQKVKLFSGLTTIVIDFFEQIEKNYLYSSLIDFSFHMCPKASRVTWGTSVDVPPNTSLSLPIQEGHPLEMSWVRNWLEPVPMAKCEWEGRKWDSL